METNEAPQQVPKKTKKTKKRKQRDDAAVRRLLERQHGLITRRQAVKNEFTRGAMRWQGERGLWQQVHPGVFRLAGSLETTEQKILAACLATDGIASHRAAARVLGLPNVPFALEVTAFRGSARVKGVRVHRLASLERVDKNWVDNIPTTSVTRTVIDLAGVLDRKDLEALVDHVLATRRVKLKFLMGRLAALGTNGRRGAGALRDVLEARVGKAVVNSEPQRDLARLLEDFGLPPGIPEFEITLPDGRLRRLDNGWPDILVGIQVDSYRHHSSLADHTSDIVRDDDAVAEGWRILRVTPEQLTNEPARVADLIARTLGVALQPRAAT